MAKTLTSAKRTLKEDLYDHRIKTAGVSLLTLLRPSLLLELLIEQEDITEAAMESDNTREQMTNIIKAEEVNIAEERGVEGAQILVTQVRQNVVVEEDKDKEADIGDIVAIIDTLTEALNDSTEIEASTTDTRNVIKTASFLSP